MNCISHGMIPILCLNFIAMEQVNKLFKSFMWLCDWIDQLKDLKCIISILMCVKIHLKS